jgi:para-aminobenzoate synthetase component 1
MKPSPRLLEVPYHADSAALFEMFADWPWAIFLDSGRPLVEQGRYDILVADPMVTLTTCGDTTEIRRRQGVETSTADPFDLVRQFVGDITANPHGLPFGGGALGYFGYDLGRRIEQLPSVAENAEQIPDMAVGIYDWALVVDHRERRSHLVSRGRDKYTALLWPELVNCTRHPVQKTEVRSPFRVRSGPQSNMDFATYSTAFKRIKHYIEEGDCYQVNLAQRFEARVEGSLWMAYRDLRALNPAPFSAYMNIPGCQVLSSSPERFLQVSDGRVETRPIKGTRRRADHPQEDLWLAEELRQSRKDRAENVMIVDLMRNDLGKVCETGSVRVPRLFDVERFATVHHLVSTVTGRIAAGQDSLGLLRACFPGGSITGAPKLRAMQIIEELEPHRRGVYCGSIGYIGSDGNMDTNIAIRTLVHSGGRLRFWAGGGIVADSVLEDEYQETFDKAAALLRLLEKQSGNRYVDCETWRQSGHG